MGITAKNFCFDVLKAKKIKLTKANKLFKQAYKKIKRRGIMKSGIRKNRPWLILPILLKFIKRKRKTAIVISIKLHTIMAIKKITLQIPIPS